LVLHPQFLILKKARPQTLNLLRIDGLAEATSFFALQAHSIANFYFKSWSINIIKQGN